VMTLTSGSTARVEDGTTTRPASALPWAHCEHGTGPTVVSSVPPTYPEQARKNRAEGVVVVQARIGTEGAVTALRVIRTPDVSRLDAKLLSDAAITALSRWRFVPAQCGGEPLEAEYVTAISFALD